MRRPIVLAILILASAACSRNSGDVDSVTETETESLPAPASCHSAAAASPDAQVDTIVNCRKLWQQSNPGNYMYTYTTALPDCAAITHYTGTVEKVITVAQGVVSSVFLPDTGTFVDENTTIVEPSDVYYPDSSPSSTKVDAPTIDEIFALLERLAADPKFSVEHIDDSSLLPEFDSQYGYPVAYAISAYGLCPRYTAALSAFQ